MRPLHVHLPMRHLLLISSLLLLASVAWAQVVVTLTGTVRDSVSQQPLAGASVVVDYRKSLSGTTTDASGHYAIKLPIGNHTVVIVTGPAAPAVPERGPDR